MILLISLESVHILHPPSFFGLSTVGTSQGLKLYFTNPFSNSSCTCCLICSFSRGVNLYVALLGKLAPGIRSMWWLILLTGGNSLGISYTIILACSSSKTLTSSRKLSKFVEVKISFGLPTIFFCKSSSLWTSCNSYFPIINKMLDPELFWTTSSSKGDTVCLFPYFSKEYVLFLPSWTAFLSYYHGLPKSIWHTSIGIMSHKISSL